MLISNYPGHVPHLCVYHLSVYILLSCICPSISWVGDSQVKAALSLHSWTGILYPHYLSLKKKKGRSNKHKDYSANYSSKTKSLPPHVPWQAIFWPFTASLLMLPLLPAPMKVSCSGLCYIPRLSSFSTAALHRCNNLENTPSSTLGLLECRTHQILAIFCLLMPNSLLRYQYRCWDPLF